MSGHSKWSTIKRQKGVSDIKRGQAFTKLANAITIAVKQGGGIGDPQSNFKLRLVIEKARSLNMPKENIERALARAAGKQAGELEEVVYEGFGPSGASVIVEAATDNKRRTTSEIKNIFEKSGGTFGQPGAVSYQFESKGLITLNNVNGKSPDDVFLAAADAGAEDVEEADGAFFIFTKPEDLATVRNLLLSQNFSIEDASIVRKPMVIAEVDAAAGERINAFIDQLENLDDVQKVYTNVVVKS